MTLRRGFAISITDLLRSIVLQSEYELVSSDTVIMKQGQNNKYEPIIIPGMIFTDVLTNYDRINIYQQVI